MVSASPSAAAKRRWPSSTKFSSDSQRRKAAASSASGPPGAATSPSAPRSRASMAGKSAVATRTSTMARAIACSSAARPSGGRPPMPDSTGPAAPSVTRIMLSRAGEAGSSSSSRPESSRRTRSTGCSRLATALPCSARAASTLSTRKGMSSVTISATGRGPVPGPAGSTRTFAVPAGRSMAKANRLAAAAARDSGGSLASSPVGMPACSAPSSVTASGGRAGARRAIASAAARRTSARAVSGRVCVSSAMLCLRFLRRGQGAPLCPAPSRAR